VLRSIIIGSTVEVSQALEGALAALGLVSVLRVLNTYPSENDLVRVLRALTPDMVFLSFESLDKAQETVRILEKEVEGIQITAIHRVCDALALQETMRAGVREYVEFPFERQSVIDSVRHTASLLEQQAANYQGTTHIFSFFPSKAGAGTSTLALNVSAALARRPYTRVLLTDLDLNSGVIRFLLKVKNEFSVLDAVARSNVIDENLWPQLVTSIDQMDVLHSGCVNPNLRLESAQIRHLIQFMSRSYDALCFDLSGNLEGYSLDVMRESRRIWLVCTPELASLHLALEKLQFLKTIDLDSRVGVILNRVHKRAVFGTAQVEKLLGVPVIATMANDYHSVNRSTASGSIVDPMSELGKEYELFASSLMEGVSPLKHEAAVGRQPHTGERKKQFLDFFSVSGSERSLQRNRQTEERGRFLPPKSRNAPS
jgi:pilus assembly protein CpaE